MNTLDEYVKRFENAKIIEKTTAGPYKSTIFLLPKSGGKSRLIIDY